MINIFSYNEYEIKLGGLIQDIKKGFNVWIDLLTPFHIYKTTYSQGNASGFCQNDW